MRDVLFLLIDVWRFETVTLKLKKITINPHNPHKVQIYFKSPCLILLPHNDIIDCLFFHSPSIV